MTDITKTFKPLYLLPVSNEDQEERRTKIKINSLLYGLPTIRINKAATHTKHSYWANLLSRMFSLAKQHLAYLKLEQEICLTTLVSCYSVKVFEFYRTIK